MTFYRIVHPALQSILFSYLTIRKAKTNWLTRPFSPRDPENVVHIAPVLQPFSTFRENDHSPIEMKLEKLLFYCVIVNCRGHAIAQVCAVGS